MFSSSDRHRRRNLWRVKEPKTLNSLRHNMATIPYVLLLIHLVESLISAQTITSLDDETFVTEGDKVTLHCSYDGGVNNLQWYGQYQSSNPEFLAWIFPAGITSKPLPPRYVPKVDKDKKRVSLEIFPSEVSDSTLYYCALTNDGAWKIVFGSGTKLFIEQKKEVKPAIYKVDNGCLATDFTRHNALSSTAAFWNRSVTRFSENSDYSSFALDIEGEECKESGVCPGNSDSASEDDGIESDEKLNYLSLGMYWLRIIFLKTVVFNFLMTVKVWIS